MAETVNARIIYWGIPGAGVSQSLAAIRGKLRGGGHLRAMPTRLDPTISYELLPISLGEVGGVQTELQVVGVPSGAEQSTTRKQLLDQVDGLVFVADATPERLEENVASIEELRASLAAYGRDTGTLPVVVQYNKRDLSDPFVIEALHRRLGLPDAAVFESVATEAKGVLQALTTVSKQVIRLRRDRVSRSAAVEPASPAPPPPAVLASEPAFEAPPIADVAFEPELEIDDPRALASAILAEGDDPLESDATHRTAMRAEALFDQPWDELVDEAKQAPGALIGSDFQIVSVGVATRTGARAVRVPLVLGNPAGETVSMALSIALDPVLDATDE